MKEERYQDDIPQQMHHEEEQWRNEEVWPAEGGNDEEYRPAEQTEGGEMPVSAPPLAPIQGKGGDYRPLYAPLNDGPPNPIGAPKNDTKPDSTESWADSPDSRTSTSCAPGSGVDSLRPHPATDGMPS